MKRKRAIQSIVVLGRIIVGIIIAGIYFCRVRYVGGEPVGSIWKDEQENVRAEIYVYLYNGAYSSKKVIFDVDGSNEYLEGKLLHEKYEVTDIEIWEKNGQVDIENGILTLTIPRREEVGLHITAQNVYIGENYKGESIGLRREPPDTSFIVLK